MNIMHVEVEKEAGFCPGVVRAVDIAERELANSTSPLYCLGDIVHNPVEVARLENMGMRFINRNEYLELNNARVLLRAHGEPPETYRIAEKNKLSLIDATCRIVTNLQKKVENAFDEIMSREGQIVIFGKKNHPEIIGLNGQIGNKALIVTTEKELEKLDFSKPIRLFSQTTMSPEIYEGIVEFCSREALKNNTDFEYQPTVCSWMMKRVNSLRKFSGSFDILVFVAGKESSNGKYLFEIVKGVNPDSRKISGKDELDENWFRDTKSVGVTGATSTPVWQLNEIAEIIKSF